MKRRDFLRNAIMLAGAGVTAPLMAAMKYNRDVVLRYFRESISETDARVEAGIEANRKGDVTLLFTDAQGCPCETVHAKVRQTRHDFKYGANIFGLSETKDGAEMAAAYKERFAAAFNLATLPFYWNANEPQPGKTRYAKDSPYLYRRPPIDMCLEWCEANGIEPKAHCLNYVSPNLFPTWVKGTVESEKKLVEKRFKELAERYARRIPMWEVTNETFFRGKDKRPISSFFFAPDFIEWNYKTAAKYFTSNRLVINEANHNFMANFKGADSAYYKLIKDALAKGCRIDSIGMQSHWLWKLGDKKFANGAKIMYNPQFIFKMLDTYAKLGRTIQITEITIPAYSTDPADEAVQAEIVRNLYRIWFSHPAMEAIIYWDLCDAYTWLPPRLGSLCRRDMSPKPAYEAICDLFGRVWRTNFERDASGGRLSFRGFCGTYEVEATANGRRVKRTFHVGRENPAPVSISIA